MRTAFIGMAGPVAYDYNKTLSSFIDGGWDVPNPVLEDVSGLAILYDELVFLSRDLCPVDMQHLHFVRFLDEEVSLLTTPGAQAREIGEKLEGGELGATVPSFDDWTPIYEELVAASTVGGRETFLRLDNHGRGRPSRASVEWHWAPNSMSVDNILFDYAAASLLESRSVDVVLSTPATVAARSLFEGELAQEFYLEKYRRAVVGGVAALESSNVFGPTGSYVPRYSDLREDDRIVEFRALIDEVEADLGDVRKLAMEIESRAEDCCFEYASKASEKSPLSRPVRAIAGVGVSVGLGAVSPTLAVIGEAVAGLAGVRKEQDEIRRLRSASFVLELSGRRRRP